MKEYHYNLKQAAAQLKLDEQTVQEIALNFVRKNHIYLTPITQALNSGRTDEAARQAHRLKGAALELRMEQIARLAGMLESQSGRQSLKHSQAIIGELKKLFRLLEQELHENRSKE
jgi:HPt (histidine-containing phosphotransfer) domain-containing protein